MSVFFRNTCEFNSCRKNFYTLRDLIVHIENDHLDFHPDKLEKLEEEKPDSLPLSYVLKFSNGGEQSTPQNRNESVIESSQVPTLDQVVASLSNNYLGCDLKERQCVKSNESRKNALSSPDEFVLDRCRNRRLFTLDSNQKKPFACNMPGCEKRYKNVNGIKYHYKNHHKMSVVRKLCESIGYNRNFPLRHAPTVKKSLLKYKPVQTNGKNKHGLPFFSFRTQNKGMYQNVVRCEEVEAFPNDYLYKVNMLPTSTDYFHVSNQVPLPNMSFNNNCYNVNDMNGDMEEFACKNSVNFFVSNLDKL